MLLIAHAVNTIALSMLWALWVHGQWVWSRRVARNETRGNLGCFPSIENSVHSGLFAWTWMKVNMAIGDGTSRNEPKISVSRKNSRMSLPYSYFYFFLHCSTSAHSEVSFFVPATLSLFFYLVFIDEHLVAPEFPFFHFGEMAKVAPVQRY